MRNVISNPDWAQNYFCFFSLTDAPESSKPTPTSITAYSVEFLSLTNLADREN